MLSTNPLLYEVPARTLVESLKASTGSMATLASVPDAWFEQIALWGFDTVWLMGVWQLGDKGREISLEWGRASGEFDRLLPGWTPADVSGSPYCVQSYQVHQDFGGNEALAVFRSKLRARGIALILDFVPNHTAQDHPWVQEHPEYYVQGTVQDLQEKPQNFTQQNGIIFAHGRDPYFPSWTDVYQLDYRKESVQQAMIQTLAQIAQLCDGVRCDMSMLVLPDIFEKTWGKLPARFAQDAARGSFWPRAIDRIREEYPAIKFIAEAYWGLEYRLQTEGFDYTYDKTFYDHLIAQSMEAARSELEQWSVLPHGVHFLENHDEPRASTAFSELGYRHSCAVLTFSLPGLRLIYDGQTDGRKLRYCIHLRRAALTPAVEDENLFYEKLFSALKDSTIGKGTAAFIPSQSTGAGNESFSAIQAILWEKGGQRDLVVVNLSGAECDARLPFFFTGIGSRLWTFKDRLSSAQYTRDGTEIATIGLYVKLQPWQSQIFEITRSTL